MALRGATSTRERSGATRRRGSRASTERPVVHERFAARVAAVRRRPHRVLWAGLVLVVVAALLGWLVWFSPVLVVRHVEVEGARHGTAAQVRDEARVPMGQPLAGVDLSAVVERVLASGDIASTTVSRSWPSTLVIHVTGRAPVMVLQNSQGQLQVVDRYGVRYRALTKLPDRLEHLPTVTLDGVNGDDVQTALSAGADALAALPAPLRHRVDQVSVQGREDVSLDLGRVSVHWGVGGDGQLKADVLRTLLAARGKHSAAGVVPASGPVAIDVSAPGEPVVD